MTNPVVIKDNLSFFLLVLEILFVRNLSELIYQKTQQ